jgi:hypothetical protein
VERKNVPGAAPIRRPAAPVFAETNLCNGRCFYEDGRFFSENHGDYWHELEYDMSAHTIRAELGGLYLRRGQAVISNLIRPILQSFILPFYGVKTLHGAVLSKDGKTVFLSGRGGAGKTTTAVQLMSAGYEILSDDGPFFVTDRGNAYALSSLDYLHLTERTLDLFPALRPHVVGSKDSREKFAVRISDIQGVDGAWRRPLPVTHYVRLSRRTGIAAPRIEKISRSGVHRSLLDECMIVFRRAPLRQSPYPFREYSEFIFDLLTKVVRGAETYDLVFADQHLAELPALIDQL